MDKNNKQVAKAQLDSEEQTLKELKAVYKKAREDVQKKIAELNSRTDLQNAQSIAYQKKYQQAILGQINEALADLSSGQYKTVEDYLKNSYDNGYIGTMYSLQAQGIPMAIPINDRNVVRALTTDSKLSSNYYKGDPIRGRLAEDIDLLKTRIRSNISRGLINGKSWLDVAVDVASGMNNPFDVALKDAMRIVRTEGHRVYQQGHLDAGTEAKSKGADIVKQWDATLDGVTRPAHMEADGQIVEWDEDFTVGGEKLKAPSIGGSAWNVINCRCQLLQRARWALDEDELETLKQRAEFFGLDKTKSFEEYKDKYLKTVTESNLKSIEYVSTFVPAKSLDEAEEYAKRFVRKKTWTGDGNISFKGLSVDNANKINETLTELFDQYNLPLLDNIEPMNFRQNIWKGSENAPFAYRSTFNGSFYFNPKIAKNAKVFADYFKKGEEAFEFCKKNIDKFTGSKKELVERYIKAGRQLVADDAKDSFKASVQHEIGHHIQNQILGRNKEAVMKMNDSIDEYAIKISGYATYSKGEYIAESFCAFVNGEFDRIDPFMKEYFEGLMK